MALNYIESFSTDCVVALGGNLPQTLQLFEEALLSLNKLAGVTQMRMSRLFLTSPVSPKPQAPFFNGCCRFETSLSPLELFEKITTLEKKLGKVAKPKDAPRPIDLDLIFYGNITCSKPELKLPHPKWHERLFVLIPLSDLIKNTEKSPYLWERLTPHFLTHALEGTETVIPLQASLPFQEHS